MLWLLNLNPHGHGLNWPRCSRPFHPMKQYCLALWMFNRGRARSRYRYRALIVDRRKKIENEDDDDHEDDFGNATTLSADTDDSLNRHT